MRVENPVIAIPDPMPASRTVAPGTVIWAPRIQAAIDQAIRGGCSPTNAVMGAIDRALKRPGTKPLAGVQR